MNQLTEIFGEPISVYTRAQAIEDGVLVDLMQGETAPLVREAGFKFPIAMTAGAFSEAVAPIDVDLPAGQDLKGRLWDVLVVLKWKIWKGASSGQEVRFQVVVYQGNGKSETVKLKSLCGPGDNMEPVITIMLPEED
ncbi:MAG: hypothetical protein O7H41_10150 [Planctomycetota bacterium]|nr:hypothetical protein [Planctomycetota bacterium]